MLVDLNMINKSLVGTITVSEGLAKYYMKGYDTSFNAVFGILLRIIKSSLSINALF